MDFYLCIISLKDLINTLVVSQSLFDIENIPKEHIPITDHCSLKQMNTNDKHTDYLKNHNININIQCHLRYKESAGY